MSPAIELLGVTKRYRAGRGRLFEVGSLIGGERRRTRERPDAYDVVDFDGDLDDDVDVEDEDELEEAPERPQRDVIALRDVSLEVAPGTVLGLIGPNGGGKSTLLRILARLTPPTEGRVVIRGRVAPFIPTLSGMMLTGETLRRNVVHVASFYGIHKDEAVPRTDEIAAIAELEDRLDDRLTWISRGELQRFAFAVALGLRPDILVADDAIAVGDRHFQDRCVDHVKARAAAGMTVLFASHQLALVRELCTEAILMDGGRIVDRGPAAEVVDAYERSGAAPSGTRPARGDRAAARLEAAGAIVDAGAFSAIGHPATVLEAGEEGLVEIVLDLPEAPATVRCILALAGPRSTDRAAQPAPFTVTVPGQYVVSAYVPPGVLDPGSYRIGVTAIEYTAEGRRVVGALKEAFTLDVVGAAPPAEGSAEVPAKRRVALRWGVAQLVSPA